MIDLADAKLIERIEALRKKSDHGRFNDGVDAVLELLETLADTKPGDLVVGEWGYADGKPLHLPSYQKGLRDGRVEPADELSVSAPVPHPEPVRDMRPHSRACGIRNHEHGPDCSTNCPTCGGRHAN